jgi:hypothetical protein
MTNKDQPLYEHDCDNCAYLGQFKQSDLRALDLYVHPGKETTVIARFSSEGSDYSSGLDFAYSAQIKNDATSPLLEAKKRAVKAGLINETNFLIGYSPELFDKLHEEYFESDYMRGKPYLGDDYYEKLMAVTDDSDDTELDAEYEEWQAKVAVYKANYPGGTPKEPVSMYHVFSDIEEAKKYCEQKMIIAVAADTEERAIQMAEPLIRARNIADKSIEAEGPSL